MDAALHPETVARLIVPSLGLSGCVRGSMWRDTTRAAGALSLEQRRSFFPASPLCGLTFTLEGEGWEVLDDGSEQPLRHRAFVGGPRSQPAHFVAADSVRSFMIAIQPEALQALTGIDVGALLNRYDAFENLLDPSWQDWAARMLAARDEQHCQQLLEDFLLPRWRALRTEGRSAGNTYRDWMDNLALRAVAGGHGESLRQVERRIKRWSGQGLRALRGISRAEATFLRVRAEEQQAGEVVWAALAQEAGYADQAHLCRETRRVTGFSPEELRRRINEDEAFWAYRIWS